MKQPSCDGFGETPLLVTRGLLALEGPIQSVDSLLSVAPSIMVLMITVLLVFRREIVTWFATGLKPASGAESRPLHQAANAVVAIARRRI
jgi:hypothetical protein